VVLPDQEFPPIFNGPPKPPDFYGIANGANTTALSLRDFLSSTHSTMNLPVHMPNPELSDDQMANIISFILSLRDGK
jgi:hypothetical protein